MTAEQRECRHDPVIRRWCDADVRGVEFAAETLPRQLGADVREGGAMMEIPGITLANPADAAKYDVGDRLVFAVYVPWWRRLWRWIKRGFRKPPPPPPLAVMGVDCGNGVVTLGLAR